MFYEHIKALAVTIGPRGSGTENERQALRYCAAELRTLGLQVEESAFRSVASAYRPFILVSSLALLAVAVWMAGARHVAVLLAALAGTAAFLEILFLPNPLNLLLPKKTSGNILGKLPAGHEMRQKIVLVAHVDSHRTPWIWRSPHTYAVYRFLSTAAMLAFLSLPFALYAGSPLIISLAAMLLFLTVLMTLQAELSPYTPGANDNASGVAMVLDLAAHFSEKPLQNTELWFAFVGCEEVGAHGAAAFVRRYRDQLGNARVVVVDNIAGPETSPRYYTSETMLRPVRCPQELLALAEKTAHELPETGARAFAQKGAYTDATPFLLAGIPCIAVVNHRDDGWIPDWHSLTDTIGHIDTEAFEKTRRFVLAFINRLAQ